MSNVNVELLLKELEQKRNFLLNEHEANKTKLLEDCPRLAEIEDELSKITYQSIRKAVSSSNSTAVIDKLKKDINKISKERSDVLNSLDIDFDYFEPNWACKACKDTGYLEDKRCSCLEKTIINIRYKDSNLYALLDYQNFDNFDLNLYSNFENNDKSPRYYANLNLNSALHFCKNFNKEYENIYIEGKSGLGKTFLCSCIAKNLIDKGFSVIYITSYNLVEEYSNIKFNKSNKQISDYINCDLLIIDDLGSENRSEYNNSILFHIINDRLNKKKASVISSNLNLKQISKQYGSRITSRISSKQFKKLKFIGNDIRTLNK